jgi:hypothetical protein
MDVIIRPADTSRCLCRTPAKAAMAHSRDQDIPGSLTEGGVPSITASSDAVPRLAAESACRMCVQTTHDGHPPAALVTVYHDGYHAQCLLSWADAQDLAAALTATAA